VVAVPIWIVGETRSCKTTYLIEQLQRFSDTADATLRERLPPQSQAIAPTALIFAANSQNRIKLADQIWEITAGKIAFHSTTPLGFFSR
jgi:hypothetical protein